MKNNNPPPQLWSVEAAKLKLPTFRVVKQNSRNDIEAHPIDPGTDSIFANVRVEGREIIQIRWYDIVDSINSDVAVEI